MSQRILAGAVLGVLCLTLPACGSTAPDALESTVNSGNMVESVPGTPELTSSAPEFRSASSSPEPVPAETEPSVAPTESAEVPTPASTKKKERKDKKASGEEIDSSAECDENYSGACVPISAADLDCPDIGASVTVVGVDVHGFDSDGDREGCESY